MIDLLTTLRAIGGVAHHFAILAQRLVRCRHDEDYETVTGMKTLEDGKGEVEVRWRRWRWRRGWRRCGGE